MFPRHQKNNVSKTKLWYNTLNFLLCTYYLVKISSISGYRTSSHTKNTTCLI